MDTTEPQSDPNSPEARIRSVREMMGRWTLEDYQGLSAIMAERTRQLERWTPDYDDQHYLSQWGALCLRYLTPITSAELFETLPDFQGLRDNAAKLGALSIALYATLERAALRHQRPEAAGQLVSSPEPPAQEEPRARAEGAFEVVMEEPGKSPRTITIYSSKPSSAIILAARFQCGAGFAMPAAVYQDGRRLWTAPNLDSEKLPRYRVRVERDGDTATLAAAAYSPRDAFMFARDQVGRDWTIVAIIDQEGEETPLPY